MLKVEGQNAEQQLSPAAANFQRLCEIVAQLRAPGGCPWDREQTNESILSNLIEEAYEVTGAIRAKDDENFKEELGDLMLVVLMHAEIAEEQGRFTIADALRGVTEKLIRRHPHVFGDSNVKEPEAVVKQWEAIKRAEKKDDSHYLASLPGGLPALMRAQKAQKKVARVNFDWENMGDVVAKVEEELGETKAAMAAQNRDEISAEIGDLLFAVVNLARKNGIDAEDALQRATDKFRKRFNQLEDELTAQGKRLGDVGLAELDAIWNRVKKVTSDE